MGEPIDVGTLDPWEIYVENATWPAAVGQRFIVDLAATLMERRYEVTALDLHLSPDFCSTFRDIVVADIAQALMSGGVVASAMPVGGGALLPIGSAEWTNAVVRTAVATGTMQRRYRSRRLHPHWVFVGKTEAALMERVHAIADMIAPTEERGPAEELGEIVLANLSAIAGNKLALDPEGSAQRVLKLLMPSLHPTLNIDDTNKFVAAVVPWLIGRFNEDKDGNMVKKDFQDEAIAEFGPFMTKRIFEKVWEKALQFRASDDEKVATAANPTMPSAVKTSVSIPNLASMPPKGDHADRSRAGRRGKTKAEFKAA